MKNVLAKTWDYLMDNLFCEKTSLFYDYIVEQHRGDFEKYLPTPDLIEKCVPNPCGWGSGMEDSMINGSCMLEAAIEAYILTKDVKFITLAKKFFKGMQLCASVSDSEGFLARSVSPVDGKTHYIDSSRDQYTHFVSAAAKYYQSGIADEDEMAFIRKTFCAFASRCRKNVTPENSWNILREDGVECIVTRMWEASAHEMMRPPMFYLAAWKIGGDETFRVDYMRFRDEGMTASEQIDFSRYDRAFAINQMQISLRFTYDYDDDVAFKERCLALMQKCANYGLKTAVSLADKYSANPILLNEKAKPWNEMAAWYFGNVSGYAYYVPLHFKSNAPGSLRSAWYIRDVGDAASLYTSLPDAEYNPKLALAVEKMLRAVDLSEHNSDAPLYMLTPYYTLENIKTAR